jgi:hypothetical protein
VTPLSQVGPLQGPEALPTDHVSQTLPLLEELEKTVVVIPRAKEVEENISHTCVGLCPTFPESP